MVVLASQFTKREYLWTAWKGIRSSKGLLTQFDENNHHYFIYGYDGPEVHYAKIYKGDIPEELTSLGYSQEQNDLDKADFEANFKSGANKTLAPTDSDGAVLSRGKATLQGWQYQLHGVEFKTSQLNSMFNQDEAGNSFGFATIKCYNAAGTLITEQTNAESTEEGTGAVKTVVDWEPTHDLEILGGYLKQLQKPAEDVRLWVIGVPDVPAQFGGSKRFASGVNLKFVEPNEKLEADGRAPKLLRYDATFHTNKMRLIIMHPTGFKHDLHFMFEIFKP